MLTDKGRCGTRRGKSSYQGKWKGCVNMRRMQSNFKSTNVLCLFTIFLSLFREPLLFVQLWAWPHSYWDKQDTAPALKHQKVQEGRPTEKQIVLGKCAKSWNGARQRLLWKNRVKGPNPASQGRTRRGKKGGFPQQRNNNNKTLITK